MAKENKIRGLCTNCETEADLVIVRKPGVFNVRKDSIIVETEYRKCSQCGDEVINPRIGNDPLKLAYEVYRNRHRLLSSAEITEWRRAYNITQGELAKLTGIGTATISRYENGSLQEESHDKLIRLAMQPMNFLRLVEASQQIFIESKKNRLIQTLKESRLEYGSDANELCIRFGSEDINEYTGFKRFDFAKLNNAILFFCQKGVFKTKLNKLLFYADFKHFKEYTTSITGAQYARVPFGPAPDGYEFLYAALNSQQAIEPIEEMFPNGTSGEIIAAIRNVDLSVFSHKELRIMAEVQEHFESFTAKQISDLSHQEPAYKETSNGQLISYNYAKQLTY